MTSQGTRDGDLTLNDGANLNMQINSTGAETVFDTIEADGDVQLDGTLNVLVNPMASSGGSGSTSYGGTWTPTLGETFDIISINSVSPVGDYDGNTSVGAEDYDAWKAAFGSDDAATDGNQDGVVNAADFVLWRNHSGEMGGTAGTITGTFDNIVVTDFDGVMAGFSFQVNYSSTLVQLEVIAAGSGSGAAVPEPSTLVLGFALVAMTTLVRRRC